MKAYNQFKDRNFEIISISLDFPNARKVWLEAVRQDGLTWTQVSDLNGWKNQAALLYFIQTLPSNFLVAPDSHIIAKNLTHEKLEEILTSLLLSK